MASLCDDAILSISVCVCVFEIHAPPLPLCAHIYYPFCNFAVVVAGFGLWRHTQSVTEFVRDESNVGSRCQNIKTTATAEEDENDAFLLFLKNRRARK